MGLPCIRETTTTTTRSTQALPTDTARTPIRHDTNEMSPTQALAPGKATGAVTGAVTVAVVARDPRPPREIPPSISGTSTGL
jgi:hypothetical protein